MENHQNDCISWLLLEDASNWQQEMRWAQVPPCTELSNGGLHQAQDTLQGKYRPS